MKKYFISCVILAFFIGGCSVLKTVMNLSRLQFKIDSVSDFTLSGIQIGNKLRLSDFSPSDILKLTTIFTRGDLPVSFQLNIEAKNPNDGSGGYPSQDIIIKSFAWDLQINEIKTISGNIKNPVTVPGVGETTGIPLKIELDMLKFFSEGGLDEVLKLALNLGGREKSTSNIVLIANPILGTSIGDLSYPEPIRIVDYSFN
ncbi:hypothetical protein ACFLS9_01635 [Bacteroidota bacterium]